MTHERLRARRILSSAIIVAVMGLQTAGAAPVTAKFTDQVFSEANYPILCPKGALTTSPQALAKVMFAWIDNGDTVRRYLDAGSNDSQHLLFFGTGQPFEEVTVVDGSEGHQDILDAAIAQRKTILNSLGNFLGITGGRPTFGYVVKHTIKPKGNFVDVFFAGGSQIHIQCMPPKTRIQDSAVSKEASASPFRLRGKIDDLAKAPSSAQFKAAAPATASFVRNDELDKETTELNGVAGLVFDGLSETVADRFILFGHYQKSRTTVSGSRTDKVEVANIGLLYDRFQIFENPDLIYNVQLGLRPTAVFDLAQKSETVGAKAYLVPGMGIGNVILGQDNDIFGSATRSGWLILHPDFQLVSEAMYVADAGINPDIKDSDPYAGVGIEAKLEFAPYTRTALDRVRLSIEYRLVKLISANIDKAERYKVGARYDFDAAGNVSIGAEFAEGENSSTFQDEKYWGVKLSDVSAYGTN